MSKTFCLWCKSGYSDAPAVSYALFYLDKKYTQIDLPMCELCAFDVEKIVADKPYIFFKWKIKHGKN